MMPMVERLKSLCLLLVGLLLVACAHNDGSAAWRSYPDAVVNINQVDPAYRAYFRSQHGSNYSLRDQREAFMAATRTARTPVPKYVPQQAERPKPKPVARRGKAAPRGKANAAPRKGSKAKGKAKAAPKGRKAAADKKAKAKPKSTKRRR